MKPVTGRRCPLRHISAAAATMARAAIILGACALGSCSLLFPPPAALPEEIPAPQEVRETALVEAARYIDMEYEWGGQDIAPRGIDCSGLVVNVYHYAAAVHGYRLMFTDSTAADLHAEYSVPVDLPQPGDLIFMGEPPDPDTASSEETRPVTHVAIFKSEADGLVTFVDSTSIPLLDINGVSERSYPAGDPRFIAYGHLLVWK